MLIGEVAERSGVSARMLRHYDRIGLVSPTSRTPGGYREYTDDDIRRLFQVEGLRSLGLGLREIVDALGDLPFSPAEMVEQLITRTEEHLAQQTRLLHELRQVQAGELAEWADVLHTISLIRGLNVDDPSERQRFALTVEEEAGARGIGALVEAALAETDINAAGALDWVLARGGDEAVPLLARALFSSDERRRRRAVDALVKIGSPRATGVLADAFEHPDPRVRSRAALARGRRGDRGAIPTLIALVASGRDDVAAADALAELATGQSGGAEEIVRLIRAELARADGADAAARQRLTAALADIPGPEANALLAALTDDSDPRVAHTAQYLLQSRGVVE
ncbi:MerR family DNA-binding transcriptional regulator [Leucobacter tenebrionis]|nr:MerR family DNA-binding transcriptional regulator [Leucobacter tenebrionis]